jgi:hypothetical protein
MMMKIRKIVATTHEARLVRPDGGRGLFGLVVEAVVVVVGMMGLSAMGSGGGGGGGSCVLLLFINIMLLRRKCECGCR